MAGLGQQRQSKPSAGMSARPQKAANVAGGSALALRANCSPERQLGSSLKFSPLTIFMAPSANHPGTIRACRATLRHRKVLPRNQC
jgi:hypothetical protein